MSLEIKGLDRVTDDMRKPVGDYANQILELCGDNLLSLTLFGTIIAGTFDPSRHVVRNVLVLSRVDLKMLRELSLRGAKLGKARIAAPLVMTPDYIQASLDSFPLELIEIQQLHFTVLGKDHFDELSFRDEHVRLECEREIKSILIGMRQGLLASAGREKLLGALEADVAERLVRTLRGLLWLKGKKEGRPYPQVVAEIEDQIGRKFEGMRAALDARARHGWDEFQTLYADVEAVAAYVEAR